MHIQRKKKKGKKISTLLHSDNVIEPRFSIRTYSKSFRNGIEIIIHLIVRLHGFSYFFFFGGQAQFHTYSDSTVYDGDSKCIICYYYDITLLLYFIMLYILDGHY